MPWKNTTAGRPRMPIGVAGAIAALAAAMLALAGCGPFGGDDETPEDAVAETVEQFLGALADEDYAAACELLTEDVRAQLQGGECASVLAAVLGATEAGTPEVEFTDIRISGNQAAVDAVVTSDSGESSERSLELLEDDGQWLISSFGD